MLPEVIQEGMPYIALFNFAVVWVTLVVLGTWAGRRKMSEIPGGIQNLSEYVLEWFVKQARAMGSDTVALVAPFIASLFAFILFSNLMMILPLPILKIPPTAYYSVPFALALTAILGITVVSAIHRGVLRAFLHLVWPNPIQLVSEVSDVLSLSLRLFGNIGGEFMVAVLVSQAAAVGIPLIIHVLGLIPGFVQPLVFTLLTTNLLANAMRHEEKQERKETAAKTGREVRTAASPGMRPRRA